MINIAYTKRCKKYSLAKEKTNYIVSATSLRKKMQHIVRVVVRADSPSLTWLL